MSTSILGYALTVARDREQGVFQRLRVTPAPTWTIMASRLAMQVLANLMIALVVVIVGTRIHHISLSAGKYGLVLLVSILGGAVFLSIGQALVGLVKSADSVNAAGRVLVHRPHLARHRWVRAGRSAAPGNRSRAGPPSARS